MTSLGRYTLLALAVTATLAAQPGRFGLPVCRGSQQELADRAYFVLCHDAERKVPAWVGYESKPHPSPAEPSPRPSRFRADNRLQQRGAEDTDYRHSGYARGHLAPAADFAWSPDALRATYVLSNVVPQLQCVNAGAWAFVERTVRALAAASDSIYVFSGPLFQDPALEVIGAGRVAVPSHFYKVVLAVHGGRKRMLAAIVPNHKLPRHAFATVFTSVDEVERHTGLDFFHALDDSEATPLEAAAQTLDPP
jgi:endonuclease G, mitochondrial